MQKRVLCVLCRPVASCRRQLAFLRFVDFVLFVIRYLNVGRCTLHVAKSMLKAGVFNGRMGHQNPLTPQSGYGPLYLFYLIFI